MITFKKNATRGIYFGELVRPDAVRKSFFEQYFELFLKYRDFIMADEYYRNVLALDDFCGFMYAAVANARVTFGELFRMWTDHAKMSG
ncbi:MAG: hypothetical protein LBR51_04420 [Bacteroidales bacterium]|jgi:hypothetical protein|nr:hypothetical protein [Bacteroidales bacterium]